MPVMKVKNATDVNSLGYPGLNVNVTVYPTILGRRVLPSTAGPFPLAPGGVWQMNLAAGSYDVNVAFAGTGIKSNSKILLLENNNLYNGKQLFIRDASDKGQPIGFRFDMITL